MSAFNVQNIQLLRNDAVSQIQLSFSLTTVSVSATTVSNSHTFSRAFAATPRVVGWSSDTAGVAAGFTLNASAMSVYIRGGSPTVLSDGTAVVTVTLEGGF